MEHLDRKINIPHKCSCYHYFTTKADKQSEQKCESDIDNNDNNDNDDNDSACGPNDPSAAALEDRVISNSHGGIHLYYIPSDN